MTGTFGINGHRLHLFWKDEHCIQGVHDFHKLAPIQWRIWSQLQQQLKERGFVLRRRADVAKRIRKMFFMGQSHDLEAHGNLTSKGCSSIEVCPSNTRYMLCDDRKWTYMQRLAVEAVFRRMRALLISYGFRQVFAESPDPAVDPLAYFRHRWNREQFPDPSLDDSMAYGGRLDRDGKAIALGQKKYWRTKSGRLVVGKAYPFFNSNWLFVFGAEYTICSANQLFDASATEPRKCSTVRRKRLYSEKQKAINQENYERAALLRDIMRREEVTDANRRAA